MIERNRHVAGWIGNILFGLVTLADGLVRCLSLGFLHTRFPVEMARIQAKRAHIRQMKKAARIQAEQERIFESLKK
jgi:hypothetical protein